VELTVDISPQAPSPAPWTFADRIYGLAHCLIDRDGRVIGTNLPIGNGPLIEQAPAMAALLRKQVAGAPAEHLRAPAAQILRQLDRRAVREPGEDDE
jgi:hypothetical protein